MTRARDLANIIGSGATSSGVITAATLEATGDTAAGDNAAIGFTSAEGLILTGQGTTGDVTIKNDADALVAHVPTGTTGVTFAGTPTFPDGSINIADLDIDGGTDIGAALVDADLMVVDDGAGGTNRKATMSRLATYMGTKVGGLKEFIVSSGSISNAATQAFTQFDSSKYVHYEFEFRNVIPVDDNVQLRARTSSNGGSSYDSGSDNYHNFAGTTDATSVDSLAPAKVGSASGELGVSLLIQCRSPHITSSNTHVFTMGGVSQAYDASYQSGSYPNWGGSRMATADVNAIQFFFASGNIESGEIRMYGIKNS